MGFPFDAGCSSFMDENGLTYVCIPHKEGVVSAKIGMKPIHKVRYLHVSNILVSTGDDKS